MAEWNAPVEAAPLVFHNVRAAQTIRGTAVAVGALGAVGETTA